MPARQRSAPNVVPHGSPREDDTHQDLVPVVNGTSDTPERFNNTGGNSVNEDRHTSTTPEGEGADPPLSPCVMTVIVQPPTTVRPGEQFGSPVVISLETRPTGTREHDIPENDARYWAVASITQNGSNLLQGVIAVNIRRAQTPPQHLNLGYLVFNNLKIWQPGSFKIYVSLVLMPDITGPSEFYTNVVGGIKVDAVLTNEVHVDEYAVTMARRMPSDRTWIVEQC